MNEKYNEASDKIHDAIIKLASQVVASYSDGAKCMHLTQSIVHLTHAKRNMQEALSLDKDLEAFFAKYSPSGVAAAKK